MGATAALALPYPDPTDRVADGYLAMKALAEAVELKLPRGYVGAVADTTGLVLAVVGTAYESVPTRVAVAAKPTIRRYDVVVLGMFNAASAAGLYRAELLATAGAVVGRSGQTQVTVVGGTGQTTAVGHYTVLVPAVTAVTFSVRATRVGGGAATDQMVAGFIKVSDESGA